VNEADHRHLIGRFADLIRLQQWERLDEVMAPDVVLENPQSGERFRGLENVRGQFADYPNLEAGTTELNDVIGGQQYALTPMYTVVAVEGTGDRGTAILRTRYPDGTYWWVVNIYEVRDGRIAHSRSFFAPEFEPPDWRARYRDAG
jgi:ketosteroid isomerase-like protein